MQIIIGNFQAFRECTTMAAKSGSEANAQGVPAWMPADFFNLGKERTDAMLDMGLLQRACGPT